MICGDTPITPINRVGTHSLFLKKFFENLPKIDKTFWKGNILLQISFFFKQSKLQEEDFVTFICIGYAI
jgi:hypothetical protein